MKLLLVEDEPALLSLLERYLGRLGYEVAGCGTRAEAAAVFEQGGFAIAVIDLTLPDGSGEELAKGFVASTPGLKVLFTSGHPSAPTGVPGSVFLQKPFWPGALGEALAGLGVSR
ncbi:MAG: response regulator [Bryobacteraceae bacterium]